jgi:hypothetical protein
MAKPAMLGEAEPLHETERAVLFSIEGEELWVPKSCIHEDSECYSMESGPGLLVVNEWWAEKEGLV